MPSTSLIGRRCRCDGFQGIPIERCVPTRLPIKFIEPASNAPEQREPDINAKEKGENAVKDITNCGKRVYFDWN
jgi:hypothetical protein